MTNLPDAESRAAEAYAHKTGTYFGGVRQDFLEALPRRPGLAILEIGCGSGDTGRAALAQGLCASYTGVELFPAAAASARQHLSEVVEGDIERVALPWKPARFDAVLMSEVLEHLLDPWAAVKRIAPFLKPGALVMASSPNVSQFRMLKNLLADRWDLTDSGLMDRTHLRWFTAASYSRMFEDAGIRVDQLESLSPPGPWGRVFNVVTFNQFRHLTMRQISLRGHRK